METFSHPKPEIVITTQWNGLSAKFQREQIYFQDRKSQWTCPWYCPTFITNRKWKCTPTDCSSCCWLSMYAGWLNRWVKHLLHIMCVIRLVFDVKYQLFCTFVCVEFQFIYICTGHPYRLPVWWCTFLFPVSYEPRNFTNDPLHCLAITTSGLGTYISISG